jgi:UDP-glucuronate decarboxylase
MRVLVTGGAGFIGSHLCERLLARGDHVICLDNFFTGRRENVEHLLNFREFELVRHDVTEPIFMDVDQIYNLACPASPIHYQYNPVKTVKSNVMGAINMLVLAKRVRARVLQASTSEVYGDPTVHPQPESYWGNVNPIGPRGVYDEAKRYAEAMAMAYLRTHDVPVKIARFFNTYGPRMRRGDGRAVPTFIEQALANEPITVHGDGSQTRSLCYVDDLVEGIWRLLTSDVVGEPVNLGNPEEVKVLDLARTIVLLAGSRSEVVFTERPEDDPEVRCPDISRATSLLGWLPRVPLSDGLARTMEWARGAWRA